jgi:anti-anti-sigma factor
MPMVIEIEQKDGICVLHLKGRLVAGIDFEFLHAKAEEIKKSNCAKVMADLREVPAMGSTGIGFLVGLYTSVTKIPDGRFVLVGAQPRVREVLELTRLSTIIPMAADMASGLAALRGANAAGGHDRH